jgi:uncharacterized RDD family membrane protein YckC
MSNPESTNPQPAGILPRLAAGLIDLLVLFAQYNVVVFLFSLMSLLLIVVGRNLELGRPIFVIARGIYRFSLAWSGFVSIIYFPYWWQRDGRTFGMRMLKLRVVKARGPVRDVGWFRAVVRWLGSLLGLGLLALGFLWIMIDERRQGWHDKLAGTLVVRTEHDTDNGEV